MATTVRSKSASAKGKAGKARKPAAAAGSAARAPKGRKGPARPVGPQTVRPARPLADRYQVVLWQEDGEWYGRGLELPGIMADGPTPDACVRELREALVYGVATLMEVGEA